MRPCAGKKFKRSLASLLGPSRWLEVNSAFHIAAIPHISSGNAGISIDYNPRYGAVASGGSPGALTDDV